MAFRGKKKHVILLENLRNSKLKYILIRLFQIILPTQGIAYRFKHCNVLFIASISRIK